MWGGLCQLAMNLYMILSCGQSYKALYDRNFRLKRGTDYKIAYITTLVS